MRIPAMSFFTVLVLSLPVNAQDTIQVSAGWNIIGSLKDGAVPDVLATDPPGIISTAFFGYAPGTGYLSTDTLSKAWGYWVKVSEDGAIIFDGLPGGEECGLKTVSYDGSIYRTVKIGEECWLDRNLNAGTMVAGVNPQLNNSVLEKYCYNDLPANCASHGGLYQWNEAMQYSTTPGVQGICPPGWHLPTVAELQTLSTTVGGDGTDLKALGQGSGAGAGVDSLGFGAMLAGFRDSDAGVFGNLGSSVHIWSSDEDVILTRAMHLYMYDTDGSIVIDDAIKNVGMSVRCVED